MWKFGTLAVVGLGLVPVGEITAQEEKTATGEHVERSFDYLLLATSKTSTLEKELNESAAAGYQLSAVMGGETAFGGGETVAVMSRDTDGDHVAVLEYKLLATNKTSTMQKEMEEAAEAGWVHRGQTAFKTRFGGREVVVIMERSIGVVPRRTREYKLLATNKTKTMQKELREAGEQGFALVGMTVAKTAFGGNELVSILERPAE